MALAPPPPPPPPLIQREYPANSTAYGLGRVHPLIEQGIYKAPLCHEICVDEQMAASRELLDLPREILGIISAYLPNWDIKNLRLTSRECHSIFVLRIPRLFISPSRKNLDVFNAVISHPELSKQVQEVIWDDARFEEFVQEERPSRSNLIEEPWQHGDGYSDVDTEDEEPRPNRKRHFRTFNTIRTITMGQGYDYKAARYDKRRRDLMKSGVQSEYIQNLIAEPRHALDLRECFELYVQLYREQQEIIRENEDYLALCKAFTTLNISRVTITCTAEPLQTKEYETPLLRSLPVGAKFPLHIRWFGRHWSGADIVYHDWYWHSSKTFSRGYCCLTGAIKATETTSVRELVFDTADPSDGVVIPLFMNPKHNFEYNDTVYSFERLHTLDFAVTIRGGRAGSQIVGGGRLYQALRSAKEMRNFGFTSNLCTDPLVAQSEIGIYPGDIKPMTNVFPVDQWKFLKTFVLRNWLLNVDDLLATCPAFSPTIEKLSLVNIRMENTSLEAFVDRLRMVSAPFPISRGIFSITQSLPGVGGAAGCRTVSDEIFDYLDGVDSQINPFSGPMLRQDLGRVPT